MTKRSRLIIVLVLMAIGAAFIWPTINWYFVVPQDVKQVVSGSRESIRDYAVAGGVATVQELSKQVAANPETPIQGQYGITFQVPRKDKDGNTFLSEPTTVKLEGLQAFVEEKYRDQGKAFPAKWTIKDVWIAAGADKTAQIENIQAWAENKIRKDILAIKSQKSRIIQLGLDLSGGMSVVIQADKASMEKRLGKAVSDTEYSEALDQTIEQLKGRIDQFGVSEPSVRKDIGANRILIEIPGDNDPERVNQFLMGGGSLALQIVDETALQPLLDYQTTYRTEHNGDAWEPSKATPPADLIPAGSQARAYVQKDAYGVDYTVKYIPTKEGSEFVVDGNYITEANTDRDQMGRPLTTFSLSSEGATKFGALTKANVGKSMAIVLDGKVRAYARIQNEIPNGRVQLEGFTYEDGRAISKVLKTGALKLDLKVESVQAVGASLGADAVESGIMAIIVGFGLIFVFMLVYYLGCGVIADIALIMKLYFMFAILAVFNLTLTMTSIAGLILTVGIAVDANVIIFERIKDELRAGKGRAAAVAGGYKKAFWTIIDSNITNLIVAILLAYLGTGPIAGFAVTLMAGIVTSLFSALFVSRLIQDFETEQLGHTKMSIAWRLK
jgi:preprotein translocase subunit SecD